MHVQPSAPVCRAAERAAAASQGGHPPGTAGPSQPAATAAATAAAAPGNGLPGGSGGFVLGPEHARHISGQQAPPQQQAAAAAAAAQPMQLGSNGGTFLGEEEEEEEYSLPARPAASGGTTLYGADGSMGGGGEYGEGKHGVFAGWPRLHSARSGARITCANALTQHPVAAIVVETMIAR